MKVVTQVAEQRKTLEQAVAQALELARVGSDAAEVAVSKTTGISVSTRFGEVENVEFNSDGALGITVYHQQRKGSASTTDLNPDAVAVPCRRHWILPLYVTRPLRRTRRQISAGL